MFPLDVTIHPRTFKDVNILCMRMRNWTESDFWLNQVWSDTFNYKQFQETPHTSIPQLIACPSSMYKCVWLSCGILKHAVHWNQLQLYCFHIWQSCIISVLCNWNLQVQLRLLMCVCVCACGKKMADGHLSRSVSLCADACSGGKLSAHWSLHVSIQCGKSSLRTNTNPKIATRLCAIEIWLIELNWN